MSIDFTFEPVDEKPKQNANRGRKGSKYEPILTNFLASNYQLVRVDGTGKEPNILAMVLKRILKNKGIDTVIVSVINQEVYLEKRTNK